MAVAVGPEGRYSGAGDGTRAGVVPLDGCGADTPLTTGSAWPTTRTADSQVLAVLRQGMIGSLEEPSE